MISLVSVFIFNLRSAATPNNIWHDFTDSIHKNPHLLCLTVRKFDNKLELLNLWVEKNIITFRLFGVSIDRYLPGKIFAGMTSIAISAGLLANSAIALLPAPLNFLIECIIIAILLAGKSLYEHIEAVREPLAEGDIEGARFAVSMIVGRDTSRLDSSDIGRAAIETGAENLSDGILAPAIWYLLGGLPLLFAYKMINTADSMVGYKSARYYAFGWGSAILDDIVNFFPARITALLIMITAFLRGTAGQAFRAMKNDASKHASPNAGYPESAMAGALGLRLGGARWYRGHLLSLPEMNHQGRDAILPDDIENALSMLWHTLGLTAIASLMIGFWF